MAVRMTCSDGDICNLQLIHAHSEWQPYLNPDKNTLLLVSFVSIMIAIAGQGEELEENLMFTEIDEIIVVGGFFLQDFFNHVIIAKNRSLSLARRGEVDIAVEWSPVATCCTS